MVASHNTVRALFLSVMQQPEDKKNGVKKVPLSGQANSYSFCALVQEIVGAFFNFMAKIGSHYIG
jgi:hypothetical protein